MSPVVQTSPVFRLPDELILSVLSYISPPPQHSDHFARFRIQHGLIINDDHRKRMEFLRPLSMTCKAMRMRLNPWIWERLELFPRRPRALKSENVRGLGTVFGALEGDTNLAIAVRFLTIHFTLDGAHIPLFVRCLEALPNLHTLEIAKSDASVTGGLQVALRHVELPQIKTLILPAIAHPLLEHCREVEDVVFVVTWRDVPSDAVLRSLALNSDSKVRRLVIPLTMWDRPSRFVAVCPKLTELTVIYPPYGLTRRTERGLISDPVEAACVATIEIVNACTALPDFDTLQIVYFFDESYPNPPIFSHFKGYQREVNAWNKRMQVFGEDVGAVKDTAVEAIKRKERQRGRKEGEGTKETIVRVIELDSALEFGLDHHGQKCLGSVRVEEERVQQFSPR